jgi:CheY-like chemotaxis protein
MRHPYVNAGENAVTEKVLLVDDEATVLGVCARSLTSPLTAAEREGAPPFTVETASNPLDALSLITHRGPYAVIVSDYRMPGMNGVELLERARAIEPSTVRMMLTGNTDVNTAIEAVNCGAVFRFLTKPCPAKALAAAIVSGLHQHRLIHAERRVLEQTVGGVVQVLTELLTMLNPTAACRAQRMRRYVQHMVTRLSLAQRWQLEVAAMLSNLGALMLSVDSGAVLGDRQSTSEACDSELSQHPEVTRALLKHIPRFENVAAIIGAQREPVDPRDVGVPLNSRDQIRLGGQVLRVAMEFDNGVAAGLGRVGALKRLTHRPGEFEPELVRCMTDVLLPSLSFEPRKIALGELRAGMILDEDLQSESGLLLMSRGHEITESMLTRIRSVAPKAWLASKLLVLTARPTERQTDAESALVAPQ